MHKINVGKQFRTAYTNEKRINWRNNENWSLHCKNVVMLFDSSEIPPVDITHMFRMNFKKIVLNLFGNHFLINLDHWNTVEALFTNRYGWNTMQEDVSDELSALCISDFRKDTSDKGAILKLVDRVATQTPVAVLSKRCNKMQEGSKKKLFAEKNGECRQKEKYRTSKLPLLRLLFAANITIERHYEDVAKATSPSTVLYMGQKRFGRHPLRFTFIHIPAKPPRRCVFKRTEKPRHLHKEAS